LRPPLVSRRFQAIGLPIHVSATNGSSSPAQGCTRREISRGACARRRHDSFDRRIGSRIELPVESLHIENRSPMLESSLPPAV
jgi:hypothetical protein